MDRLADPTLRVLLCTHCTIPLEASVYGATVTCSGCGAPNTVMARDDRPLAHPQGQSMPENVRIERLRQQDGRPLQPPPSLHGLIEGGTVPAWKVQEAFTVWQHSRREVVATHSHEASERMFFLTLILGNVLTEQGDFLRLRGLYESALDVLPLPRHKQMMRGSLARLCIRQGDFAGAERWLVPCDPRSDDLMSDSAWRVSRALVDTARNDPHAVLTSLGGNFAEVPVLDAMDGMAVVVRAHAWERQGRMDAAVAALLEYYSRGGASGRQSMRQVVDAFTLLRLCPESLPRAEQSYGAQAGQQAAERVSGGIHKVFVPIGLLLVLPSGAALLAAALGALGVIDVGADYALVGVILGVVGMVFLGIGLSMAKAAKRAAYLRLHGLVGTGRVREVRTTGVSINDVPQMEVVLDVTVPGHPPYASSAKMLMHGHVAAQFGVGATVPVRADPNNVRDVLIESD